MSSARLFLLGCIAAAFVPVAALAQAKPSYPDAEAAQHVGEEATVTGKVETVSKPKTTTYLNFGGRFPNQVFNGVIFARDEEKVGDVKQFEGKTVALTGKIELGPDQKPQIIIRSAEQLKMADGTAPMAAAPAPPAAPAPAPAPPPAPTTLSAASAPSAPPAATVASAATFTTATPARKIELAPNWNSPTRGGDLIRKDLATLFGTRGTASESREGDPSIIVYPGIPFLTPAATARKSLNLENAAATKLKITCPGLPVGSLSAYVYGGIFPGGFNRLYLITDLADQVVSVLTVEENSRQRSATVSDNMGYHTYNFIVSRTKGTNDLVIKHDFATDAPPGIVLVESLFIDPTDGQDATKSTSSRTGSTRTNTPRLQKTGKVLERSHWYVPVPLVNLILRSVSAH